MAVLKIYLKMMNDKFTSEKVLEILKAVKERKRVLVKGREIKILSVKDIHAEYPYAKVHVELDPGKSQYLEFYWVDCPFFGIEFSEDINEFEDFNYETFKYPNGLERNGIKYNFAEHGVANIDESDGGIYEKGDKISYWDYVSEDGKTRISLGYHQRLKKWLNMFAEKLTPEEISYE
jgi:hypothetical protein